MNVRENLSAHSVSVHLSYNYLNTYGNFILMKTRHMKNEIRILIKPTESRSILFNLGVVGLFV